MTTRTKTRRRPQLEALEGRALLSGPGTLDPTFGTGGQAITSFAATGYENALGNFLQPDGKIVAVGCSGSPNWLWDVARYNPDGTLDTSFGGGAGKVSTPLHGYVYSGALDPDPAHPSAPKILLAGDVLIGSGTTAQYDFQLVRFNNDGTLDTSFGGTGKVTAGSGSGGDALWGVAVQPDGKIVAGGDSDSTPGGYGEAALLRYNPDGTLDTSFGAGGKVLTIYQPANPQAGAGIEDLVLQPDGKIVTSGQSASGSSATATVTVARYNPDGSLDTGFGTAGTGLAVISQGNSDARSVALQPDGKIVVAGELNVGSANEFAVARLNPDGTLDSGFGTGGFSGVPQGHQAHGVAVQTSGGSVTGIVAAGLGATTAQSIVVRLDASGQLDSTFGSGGVVTETSYMAQKVAIQPDGNILVGGSTPAMASNKDFIVNRYLGSAQATPQFAVTAQPPASVTAGSPFGLTVEATDASGNLMPSYNGTVTVGLSNNPGGGTLGGTLTVTASNGYATFTGLSLTKAASGYTLSVSGIGLAAATTTAVAVTPAAATQLVITQQPPASVSANSAFTLIAAIEDQYGNVVTNATNAVTVSLASNPGGSTLGGTTTMTAVGGYVTFSNLTLNRRGRGYRLKVAGTGLTAATTSSFTVS